jgi:hypothetical protein
VPRDSHTVTPGALAEGVTLGAIEMLLLGAGAWLLFGGKKSKPVVPLAPTGLFLGIPAGSYKANPLEHRLMVDAGEAQPEWTVYVVPEDAWPDPTEIGAVPLNDNYQGSVWLVREGMVDALLVEQPLYAPEPPPTNGWGPVAPLVLASPDTMADYCIDPHDGRRLPVHREGRGFG